MIPPLFSYRYNFATDDWNAVYKYTMGKNFKMKAGYDSEVRVGWASLWVRTLQLLCFYASKAYLASVISYGAIELMNLEISLLEQRFWKLEAFHPLFLISGCALCYNVFKVIINQTWRSYGNMLNGVSFCHIKDYLSAVLVLSSILAKVVDFHQ